MEGPGALTDVGGEAAHATGGVLAAHTGRAASAAVLAAPPGPVSDATAWAAWGSSAVAMAGGVLSAVEDGSLIVFVFLANRKRRFRH